MEQQTMELYNYFRSSASYRVRIALALKGQAYDYKPVHLAKNEQFNESYQAVSAARLVPLLRDGDAVFTQSLAIIEYLDETHPEPPLLPPDAAGRARVRALALDIACEIHPLNNLRVLRYLVRDLKLSDDDKNRWYRHWVETGLEVVERQLAAQPSTYCHGDRPTLADCVLVPQIFNARRFDCRLDHVPNVMRVHEACMRLPAFDETQPERCPDAE
jgi:maleylacetoacetate isomerase/maleylpyruvate isomerase